MVIVYPIMHQISLMQKSKKMKKNSIMHFQNDMCHKIKDSYTHEMSPRVVANWVKDVVCQETIGAHPQLQCHHLIFITNK